MRIFVAPGTYQALPWHLEIGQKPEDGIRVAVCPATYRQNRAFDRLVVLGDGTVAPVSIPALMPEPSLEPKTATIQASVPHLAPAVAHDLGIGWQ